MPALRMISDILLIAGGLNWGTIAVTGGRVNPVDQVSGGNDLVKNIIYGAVGAAALYTIADDVKNGFPGTLKRV